MPHVQRIPGAGVIHVEARIVVHEAVVARVVDALEGEHRSELIPFRGVVVDDVENHLDAGLVESPDHRFEFLHLLPARSARGVLVVRREESDGVVAPEVLPPRLDQTLRVNELMDREQFDRGHAETLQVVDRGGMARAQVGAADVRGNFRMLRRETLHVHLVDDRLVPRGSRAAVVAPVEPWHRDHGPRNKRRGVAAAGLAAFRAIVQAVGVDGLVPLHAAVDRLGVRVEQELRGITAMPFRRLPGSVNAESIPLSGLDPGEIAVPHEAVRLREIESGLASGLVEEAELESLGDFREDCEIGAAPVPGRTERISIPRPDLRRRHATEGSTHLGAVRNDARFAAPGKNMGRTATFPRCAPRSPLRAIRLRAVP